jgi:hypothetical protein
VRSPVHLDIPAPDPLPVQPLRDPRPQPLEPVQAIAPRIQDVAPPKAPVELKPN